MGSTERNGLSRQFKYMTRTEFTKLFILVTLFEMIP